MATDDQTLFRVQLKSSHRISSSPPGTVRRPNCHVAAKGRQSSNMKVLLVSHVDYSFKPVFAAIAGGTAIHSTFSQARAALDWPTALQGTGTYATVIDSFQWNDLPAGHVFQVLHGEYRDAVRYGDGVDRHGCLADHLCLPIVGRQTVLTTAVEYQIRTILIGKGSIDLVIALAGPLRALNRN